MTDAELLELVQSKSPEELTPAETALLRRRLSESEELRTALFETLQMEAYLAAALGPVDLKPEQIVARAAQVRDDQLKWWMWAVAGAGCILLVLFGYGILRSVLPPADNTVAVVPPRDEKPVDSKPKEPVALENQVDQPPVETPEATQAQPRETNPPPATPVEEKPPVAAPQPNDPWWPVLQLPAEQLPKFSDVCFQDFPYRTMLPRRDTVNKWFEAVPGRTYRVADADTRKGKCGKIEGFARLKAPLPADGGFRFAPEDYNHLAIHAYHGDQGVALVYYEEQRQKWVAYATTRKAGESKYETLAIAATDDERARRAEMRFGGPLELRYRDGELLLLRGDVALVQAPLPGPPDDVYFDGKITFEGLSLVRTQDLSLVDEPAVASQTQRAADWNWTEKLTKDVAFQKTERGGVRLAGTNVSEPALVSTALPGYGFREIVCELTDVGPGASVFLTSMDQPPQQVIRFFLNTRTKNLNAALRSNDDFYQGDLPPLKERPEIAVRGQRVWLRLLAGDGCLKWWLSTDGMHWAIGDPIYEAGIGPANMLGLGLSRRPGESGITLASLSVKELPEISGLADRALVEKSFTPAANTTFDAWHAKVVESCPVATELSNWRRACAVRALGAGVQRELSQKLLEALLDDPVTQSLPPEKQLALLREVMVVETDPRDIVGWKRGWTSRVLNVGKRFAAQGGLPFSSVREVLLAAPTWTQQPLSSNVSQQAEEELIRLLEQGHTDQAIALCEMLRLYHFHENRPLFAWAEAAARREIGRVTGEGSRTKESWRQPLVEELNKEVYNFAADLHAIVESGALDDASRMIAGLEAERGSGLTPSGKDRNLFVSLSGAVKLALAEQPKLRAELGRKQGALAALRVRQAVASGDELAISLAATQFEGTEAAAEAYRWLGDRALQNGWFSRALSEYRRAEATGGPALAREVAPRARLAAAMMGVDYGRAITEPVSIGDTRLAAAEFEALVTEMKSRGTSSVQESVAFSRHPLPGPAQYQPQNRARLDGPVGQNPHDDGAPRLSQWKIDYAGRQLATVVDGDVIYVSNRFQIAAYSGTGGQRLWQSETPKGDMRRGQDWPLAAMRPLVAGSAIYARLLYGKSPTLVCFDKASGKKLWQVDGTEQQWWVGDPLFVQGQLLALNLQRDGNREAQLRLTVLDPYTGETLVQRRLIGLRDSWSHRRMCEVASLDDGLLIALGGVLVHCDAAGSVRWVRKQLVLPHEERPTWVLQHFAPPLVIDGKVLSVQPGVETLECVELATGRLLWSYVGDRPRRILGRSGQRLIAETDAGYVALNLGDGSVAWSHDEPLGALTGSEGPTGIDWRLTAAAATDEYVVYGVRRGPVDKPKTPVLVWLKAADGAVLGESEIAAWQDADPRVGPLVLSKDQLWTFFGKEKDPNRDLVELTPAGPPKSSTSAIVGAWQKALPPQLVRTVAQIAPGWELVAGYARANVENKAEWQGEKEAALVLAKPEAPAMLVSQQIVEAGKPAKLHLRLGHESNQPGKFSVLVDGEAVFSEEWKAENANSWKSLSVDLSRFGGRRVLMALVYQPTAGADHAWWIKETRLEQ
jgi:outer membrane protein assembly factor BamB